MRAIRTAEISQLLSFLSPLQQPHLPQSDDMSNSSGDNEGVTEEQNNVFFDDSPRCLNTAPLAGVVERSC